MRRAVLALAAGAAVLLGGTPVALAADAPANVPVVRNVDTSRYPEVRLEVSVTGQADLKDVHLRENGATVEGANLTVRPLAQTSRPVGSVLVIDTSGSMKAKGALDQAKTAAREFIAGRDKNEWVAVVSFSSSPMVRTNFTQDSGALNAAIDALTPVGETALWDGLITASHLYDQRTDLQPNLVLLSDGADSISRGTRGQALAALSAAHAAVYTIGIASSEFDPAVLSELVGSSGGSASTTGNPAELTAQFAKIRSTIESQYEVTYRSPGKGEALAIELTIGGGSTQVQTRPGAVGAVATPTAVTAPKGFVGGTPGKLLIFVLAALTAALAAFGVVQIFGGRADTLDNRLFGYGGTGAGLPVDDTAGGSAGASFVESGLVQRAVSITSRVAERGGILVKVERLLEQANLPLRAAEALFFYGAGVALVAAAMLFSAPTLPVGLIFTVLLAVAPVVVIRQLRKKRLKQFEAQLPDTLNLLSGSLRAGYSFLQGLEAVAQETSGPMARELRRVLAEARLGRPLEDALGDVAVRMESNDFDWSVMAIRIQREVGGNLAELLQTVAETMIERSRLRGEVKALTAEGRISGIIMGLLPVVLGLFMFTASPEYIEDLFGSFLGWAMVIGSAVMAVAGFAWINKIIKIEV